ncbi:Short chain dehydrogenase [Methanosarcina siciliae T4/M]|uniref:Short chain dehydrogenase n=2 Tax=Methanosarcina siciliae TaxID=38027 RepID=A0A0E3LB24_9EURY|nr:SDR family oxidoreductase [Methanosarcina siciliae]AKB29069.1 Short chain dehydrogenase [Methanosarcina siciliae T4/M]AKB33026.1 Short chain dehydrogenase [Methanosarcina siciliae HI350]
MSKTILITGAGHGFGKGTSFGLARAGHKVIAAAQIWPQVWDLRTEAKEQALELEVIKLDIRDEIDRHHALTYDIDILVNNAGVMESGAMAEIPVERVRESFETNVFGHLELTQGFVRKMIKQGHGKVVWISSMGGILKVPFLGAYCATKHAIEAIAWVMKEELAPYGVKVATINPGAYRTGFNDTGAESAYQWYDPEKGLTKLPDYRDALSQQYDPQEMIDVMVEVIPSDDHLYRTVKPETTADIMKQVQANEWKAKV